jgi:hypothetical protein
MHEEQNAGQNYHTEENYLNHGLESTTKVKHIEKACADRSFHFGGLACLTTFGSVKNRGGGNAIVTVGFLPLRHRKSHSHTELSCT